MIAFLRLLRCALINSSQQCSLTCRSQAIRREIKVRVCNCDRLICYLNSVTQIWSDLRHPHILRKPSRASLHLTVFTFLPQEFLGANVLDDKPFIVMPLMENGNARDYIDRNPTCDRQRMVSCIYIPCTSGNPRQALPYFTRPSVPSRPEYSAWRS